ncbi:MAG: glycosyltransferase family 2 protein [Candidatus Bathyarchaeia archaeon]
MSRNPAVSILVMVPTLNEEKGIRRVLQEMPEDFDVLVVDGGSTDTTVEAAKQYRAIVIRQRFGRGKGCGVRTGMEFFLNTTYDILCMIDGDGSNDPKELPKMIEAMDEEKAEVVLGSRIRGKREKGAMGPFAIFSNFLVSLLLGLRFLRIFTDVQTGYWTFSTTAVQTLYPRLKAKGFEIEMEIFVSTFKAGLRCVEVPVRYKKRLGKTKFRLFLRLRNFGYMIYYLLCSFF